jgi:excisionase family DNA binding protein
MNEHTSKSIGGEPTERLLEKNGIAEMLNQTPRSVENHMRNGMPYFKIGRSVRFRETDVMAWLESKCRVGARL